jgi:hypothetical protein
MRFIVTEDGAGRLGLDPSRVCGREFNGPSVREGLLGGFPRGVQKWLKRELKVMVIDQIDTSEARLAYYVLTMRNVDHTLLPISRFDDLALTDFELVKHVVTERDQDGDCGECNMSLDNTSVHIQPDTAGSPGAAEVPPTTGTGSQATTET